jgi:hypothetical protein
VLALAPAEGGADEAATVALGPVLADASGELPCWPPVPVDDVDTLPGVPAVVWEDDGRTLFPRNGIIA